MRILGAPGTTALPQACAALRSAVEDLGSDAPGLAAHLSFRLHCLQVPPGGYGVRVPWSLHGCQPVRGPHCMLVSAQLLTPSKCAC